MFLNPALILTPEQEALGHRRSIIVPENVALAVSLAPNTVSNFKEYTVFLYHAGFKQGLNIGQKTMREAKDREIARLQAEHAKELEALRNQASGVGFVIKFPHQPESFNGANALQEIISFDEELPSQDVLSRLLQARIEMDKGIRVTQTPLGDGSFNISTKYSFSNQSLSNIQYLLRGNLLQKLKNGCEPNPDSSGGNGGGGAAKDDSKSSPTPSAQLVSTENSTGNRRFPTGLMSLLGGC
jgi:hypothetical protein